MNKRGTKKIEYSISKLVEAMKALNAFTSFFVLPPSSAGIRMWYLTMETTTNGDDGTGKVQ